MKKPTKEHRAEIKRMAHEYANPRTKVLQSYMRLHDAFEAGALATVNQVILRDESLKVKDKLLNTLREEIERLKSEPIRVGPPAPRCSFTACHWPKCDCNKF